MAEKSLVFSGPMVRAIIERRKTMTRRILNPQPVWSDGGAIRDAAGGQMDYVEPHWVSEPKPLYAVGDLLWVRERITRFDKGTCDQWIWYRAGHNFTIEGHASADYIRKHFPDQNPDEDWKAAEGPAGGKPYHVPPRFMPKWASRITLKVTAVRVERLQDISEDDAKAEGVETEAAHTGRFDGAGNPEECGSYRLGFMSTWHAIHGPDAWAANPWVVAISFERVTA